MTNASDPPATGAKLQSRLDALIDRFAPIENPRARDGLESVAGPQPAALEISPLPTDTAERSLDEPTA